MVKVSAKYGFRGAVAASVAALVSIAALSASGARQADPRDMRQIALADHRDAMTAMTPTAREMFPDAPDGVDPVVTGPVSAEFRAQQRAAGCAEAIWPRVPVECYPD